MDLLDLWRGTLTPRRVMVLVGALPTESATAQTVHGEAASWTRTDHLLANVSDALAHISWQLGGGKGSRPKPMRRPGVRDQTVRHGRTRRSRAEVVEYLRRYGPPKRGDDAQPTSSPEVRP